jgi:DNA helicase-2/ATP-dependent DNA helicase PcrA
MELNAAQMEAVTSENRRLLILAGPGTGKTETLTERITHFIESKGLPASRVLMFTYTNKAASNMSQRVRGKLSLQADLCSGTFHSLCYRLIQRELCTKGLLPPYKVLPEHHASRLRKEACDQYTNAHPEVNVLLRAHRLQAPELLELYERKTKLNLQSNFLTDTAEEVQRLQDELTEIARNAAAAYGSLKDQYRVFDFNDLLHHFMRALQEYAEVRQLIQFQFPHIYVDEYQDTNRVQVAILQQLVTPDSYLTVVGDDAQSIYSFQGSQVENIRSFAQDFPGTRAVVLNENYRSSPPVVGYINAINATCDGALTKTLVSRGPPCEVKPKRAVFMKGSQEAEWVVNEVQELMKNEQVPLNEIAVLTRVGHISGDLERHLQRNGIPYTREGGMKFVDLRHIQLFISFLELLENPQDRLAWEVLLPAIPNIGEHLTQVIIRDLQANQGNWTWAQPPVFSLGRGKRFESLMNFWRDMINASQLPKGTVKDYLDAVLPSFRNIYTRYFHVSPRMVKVTSATQLPDRMEDHIEDIQNYIIALSTSYIGLVKDFISEIVTSRDQKEVFRGLTLSTIHSAKGLEWTAVFVIGNTEKVFPSPGFGLERNQTEEERRLYYVACSRAKKYLYVTCAHTYQSGGAHVRGNVSRFADDPRTVAFLLKVKDPGHDPFYSVNPHRVQSYFITLPPPNGDNAQAAAEPASA